VRKQYHFWPAGDGGGFDAWDVDRLIKLSREVSSPAEKDHWFRLKKTTGSGLGLKG